MAFSRDLTSPACGKSLEAAGDLTQRSGGLRRGDTRCSICVILDYCAHRQAGSVPGVAGDSFRRFRSAIGSLVATALSQGSLIGVIVITAALRDDLLIFRRTASVRRSLPRRPGCRQRPPLRAGLACIWTCSRWATSAACFPAKAWNRSLQIAALRPQPGVSRFGGRPADLRRWQASRRRLPNLKFWGHVSPARVPECLGQFGIALLPNQPSVRLPNGDDIGRFTSPMKLFEYMAAGRAIIASDLPTLREVLTDDVNCLLVPP